MMLKKPYWKLSLILFFLLLSRGVSSCNNPAQQPRVSQVSPSSTSVESLNPTSTVLPTKMSTSEIPVVYLAKPLPHGMILDGILPVHMLSSDPQAPLWFGPLEGAPAGEVLCTSTWVHALVAPFPTLVDDIRLVDLIAYWHGDKGNQLKDVSQIYVPKSLAGILDVRWGSYVPTNITVYEDSPEVDALWRENAWAILPFDALSPQLKVIRLDGISPLYKDYNSELDPLAIKYQLVKRVDPSPKIEPDLLQSVLSAIRVNNRETNKLTTLVMTGVTALVRATAYKMEIHGMHYPAEKIVHWLADADLTHISNEVSFYEDCPFPDPNSTMLLFCSHPKYIALFETIGADIIELTGNHNMDVQYVYGKDVIPFTLDLYQQFGMQYYGGGLNLADATAPLLITHNGTQLAFLGCNAPGPDFAWATDDKAGAAPCGDYDWMVDAVQKLTDQGYLPIVTLQYYEDYYNYPEVHHKRDFNLLAEAGAVIVNGSQAHRPKGMAFTGDTFIHYGLGNLFFDQMGYTINGENITQTRWEVVQRHTFYDNRHLSTELLTAMLEDYAQPRPMTASERMLFLEELFSSSEWISR